MSTATLVFILLVAFIALRVCWALAGFWYNKHHPRTARDEYRRLFGTDPD